MPDVQSMEIPKYGNYLPPCGEDSFKGLRKAHKEVAFDVMLELAKDPFMYPDRIKPVTTDGKAFVYSNNEEPFFQITFEVDKKNKKIYFMHFAEVTQRLRPI